MYKRESKAHFNRRIQNLNNEKRLTKNQRLWEEEAYKLNNRLASAEKRGFNFADDLIPERPKVVRKKDIDYLKSIRGNAEYVKKSTTFTENAISGTEKERLIKKGYGEEILAKEVQTAPEPYESEYPERSDYDTPAEEYEDTYEPEPFNPQKDYYDNDTERNYDNELPPTEGYTVIENIRQMFGRQSYEIESNKWATDENLRIKYDAAQRIFDALSTAISILGEDGVARGIQTVGAKAVNDAAEIALFLMYRDEAYTENMTIKNIDIVIDAFFAADPSSKMSWDFENQEDDMDI